MGQVQSQDDTPMPNMSQVPTCWGLFSSCLQPVVPLSTATRSFTQEARKALPMRNPFIVKFDEVLLKTDRDRKKRLNLSFTALQKCQAVIYHHISSGTVESLSECSTPDVVPADWELKGVENFPTGDSLTSEIGLGVFNPENEASEVLLLNVSAVVQPAEGKWTQWYFLRFEPFKSGDPGVWSLTQWEEKMQIGKKVYSIMKIYSTKDEAASTSAICLICSTEAANTMVLPCRHLCLCSECAAAVRMRDQKCPICRAGISSLLQLESHQSSS